MLRCSLENELDLPYLSIAPKTLIVSFPYNNVRAFQNITPSQSLLSSNTRPVTRGKTQPAYASTRKLDAYKNLMNQLIRAAESHWFMYMQSYSYR